MQGLRSFINERNAHDVKYLTTYGIRDAHGIIKEINQQIDDDLMIVPPNSLSSPSERVHPLRWASIREFLVVETHVPRATKETVAATISELNTCPYCEDAHEAGLIALGDKAKNEKTAAITEWSQNTRNPHAQIIQNPPFSAIEAPEIIGTALLFHSTNRLVSIFLAESMLPGIVRNKFIKKIALNFVAKIVKKDFVGKKVAAGRSLQFIGQHEIPQHLHWAKSVPAYTRIFTARESVLAEIEKSVIPPTSARILKEAISAWQGENMPLGRSWLADLTKDISENEKPIAAIMLLAAFAPYTVTENDIRAFQKTNPSDKDLLETCFWSIEMLTNKIATWITNPFDVSE